MAERTGIEWTDATVNFWWGCTRVGPGCDHCYADSWATRYGEKLWGAGVPRRKIKSALKTLYRLHNDYSWWAADAEIGKLHPTSRRRVFIQSMSDLFDKEVPLEWFDEALAAITACDKLDIQIVTKRISLVEKRLAGRPWPKHAGLIISVVNQAEADRDIPRLLELKTRLGIPWVGLSMEPLLGPVVLRPEWLRELDWVIVGGESGAGARYMCEDWAQSIVDQGRDASIPVFVKQLSSGGPKAVKEIDKFPEGLRVRECPAMTPYTPEEIALADGWFEGLSFDAKAVAGGWFGMMVPGKGKLTFQLQTQKPSKRAQDALNELVCKGLVSVEAFNRFGGLVYRPLVRFGDAFKWLGEQRDNPEIRFALTEEVESEKDARAHQRAALRANHHLKDRPDAG